MALCLFFAALPAGAPAATLGKSYFFATRDACVASGAFAPRECAAAFANARAQMRDRAPRFSASDECRMHFRLCERIGAEAPPADAFSDAPDRQPAYAPAALGVEMIAFAKGVEAAPALAVETPDRVFPLFPVSTPYVAEEGHSIQAKALQDKAAILAPDRFVPFSKGKPFMGKVTFAAAALGAIQRPTTEAPPVEAREQRRLRLKSAPLVQ